MRRLLLVVGIVALTSPACSDPASVLPTTPSPPSAVGLEIAGPASIAPGQTVQLLANIRLADGTVKVTSPGTPVQWFSSNSGILRVTSTGVATAGSDPGDARITAIYGSGSASRSANKEFVVVPAGTFRLVGTVSEAEFPAVPVAEALVTVSPGALTYVTGFDGSYRLYGVPADAVIAVTKTGYTAVTQPIKLTEHATRNFALGLNGTRLTLSGLYTLTIDTTGFCSGNRPLLTSLRRRTYDATVTQNGPELTVSLTEPRFRLNSISRGNRFSGRAGPGTATFVLDPFYSYYYPYYGPVAYPNVAERLSDSTILIPSGNAVTNGTAAGLTGSLEGLFEQWSAAFPSTNNTFIGSCSNARMVFTLTPR